MDCIGMRFDENLLGRLIVAKIKGTDGFSTDTTLAATVQSTVLPDIQFASFAEWKKYVHEQTALTERLHIEQKQMRESMVNNIDYYYTWINDKFSKTE